jgi:phage terminase large subunit-like protein
MTTKPKQPIRGLDKPRLHNVFLSGPTRGGEVAELAERIGLPLLPWQRFVLDDMLTVDKNKMFIRKTSLAICARQNGKTHLARMRILAGLFLFNERNHIVISSARSMALTTFREVANAIEDNLELKKQLKKILYTNGNEAIILKSGARLDVRAATRDSARGATADFLFVDELREVDQEAFAAALPVTRAKPNSQTLLASNAGDAFSTTLNELRERCQSNPPPSLGYYEYSAPPLCALDDRKGWAAANPALGILITEEALEEALTVQTTEQFRTESLSQWIDSLLSPWPFGSVEDSSDISLKMSPGPLTVFAFDVSPSRRDASLVMGQLLPNGKIGLAVLDTYSSQVAVDEVVIAASIKKWADLYYPRVVCYDKYTTASIAQRLQNAGVQTRDVSGQSFYQACSDMYDALVNDRLRHSGQDALIQQMANCAAKQTPDAWRIVRRKSAGPVDIPIGLAMVIHILAQPVAEAKVYA